MSSHRLEQESLHFVTGRLASHALQQVLSPLAREIGFQYSIQVMPITVAALMTPEWIAARLKIPPTATRIMIPGYCDGDLTALTSATDLPIEVGPRDLWDLPYHFGRKPVDEDEQDYNIEIIAEINNAPRWQQADLIAEAVRLKESGADVIDVGCEPNGGWTGAATVVRALRDAGLRVSIDSFDPVEIAAAVRAGAELVLSVNSTNREQADQWGCEVVAIPDTPADLRSLDETVEFLAARGVPLRIDPIIEPIGCGFANSLARYVRVRQKYPDAEMMMGIGNLTEMTDADSAAINVLLLGFCQELGIHSVLTTQVINWARTSVRECDLARRLVARAVRRATPPKNISDDLLLLRDPRVTTLPADFADQLAQSIRDHHVRIFADDTGLHMISAQLHCAGTDPFEVFAEFARSYPRSLDASHAFYLGYEMAKATTAMTLGKQYTQDEPLRWGFLTRPERHRGTDSFQT